METRSKSFYKHVRMVIISKHRISYNFLGVFITEFITQHLHKKRIKKTINKNP